jgi:SAM-dependent methyltransferase
MGHPFRIVIPPFFDYEIGMENEWNQRYRDNNVPWNTNEPDSELKKVLEEYRISPGRALDAGCGTGTNSVYLASRGFDVTGFDFAPLAIEAAKKRVAAAKAKVQLLEADIFKLPDLGPPFQFILDRGCFHIVRKTDEAGAVRVFERLLAPDGHLLVLAGNANEENPPEQGPPRVTEAEMCSAFKSFEIIHLRPFLFDKVVGYDYRPLAWSMLLKKR